MIPKEDVVGDHYNCPCPHCGKNSHYITDGVKINFGTIKIFSKPCHYCKKDVFYQAEYVVKIIASKERPIERLKK